MKKGTADQTKKVVPPFSAVGQLMGLYVIVAFIISFSWLLGTLSFSFLWIFGIIMCLFGVWKTRLFQLVEHNLDWHKEMYHRKRALRQEETAEWLNFVVNRWWVFSSSSIEDLVRRRINNRLVTVKPSFIDHLELKTFTFGDITPSVRCIKAFECSADGVRSFQPVSWTNVLRPPAGLHKMSAFQVVIQADMASRCEEFRVVFGAQAGGPKVGLHFDIDVEELQIKGTLQMVLHMTMEVPFPHIARATVSFTNLPEVWFNVRVFRALQLMEIPLLKSWIHANVMEGITKALVDPGSVDISLSLVGPVNSQHYILDDKIKLAQGVLTIYLKGMPAVNAAEDIHYTRLQLGKCKRQTMEMPATQIWEDCCSFFVHDLSQEILNIKHKCKRLLNTVTLDKHDLDLSAFPFQVTKQVVHEIENKDGSKLNLHLNFSLLPPIDLHEKQPVDVLLHSGVMYVCVHCANNVIASDTSGSSDPYCVVFCDRRRVLTTPYISQNRNPNWQSHTEFFVKDFSQCQLSFYVFDWDGTNTLDNDFLGSAYYIMSKKEPYVLHKQLVLGYNKQGQGHVDDTSLGQITVSIIFRSVSSVERSERYRLTSTDSVNNNEFLYIEDMVSPGTVAGEKRSARGTLCGFTNEEFMKDKIFVDLSIQEAKHLVAMDHNGFSDPFCQVLIGEKKLFTTKVKKKTLSPVWNESFMFEMTEDCGILEIQLFDQDIMFHDFLGKLLLTLDQLKELSLRGTSDWFQLENTKSGEIMIKCNVTSSDTLNQSSSKTSVNMKSSKHILSAKRSTSSLRSDITEQVSLETDVFEVTVKPQDLNASQIPPKTEDSYHAVEEDSLHIKRQPGRHTLTPKKSESMVALKRSASDNNVEGRYSQTNSVNSLAVFNDPNASSEITHDKIYHVTGKVLWVHGLKCQSVNIYCKVRIIIPHRNRLRKMFGNRVIAKSSLVKDVEPVFNMPFDVDRGLGVSRDTMIRIDIKSEGKELLASNEFNIKNLFSGPGGEGDKIQQVLPLKNDIQVEVFLQHSSSDGSTIHRQRPKSRGSSTSRSFRK